MTKREQFEADLERMQATFGERVPEQYRNRMILNELAAKYGFWYTLWQMVGR